jgi:hypothetical protein
MKPLRVAIFADFPEEGWPSMDRVAAMLVEHLRRHHTATIVTEDASNAERFG